MVGPSGGENAPFFVLTSPEKALKFEHSAPSLARGIISTRLLKAVYGERLAGLRTNERRKRFDRTGTKERGMTRLSRFAAIGAIVLALVAFLAPLASAQVVGGAIAGVVRDTTGAVMPGVTVEA